MPCTMDPRRTILPADPSAPGLARKFLREACRGQEATVVDEAELLVSELVTNAIQHGAPPIELLIRCAGDDALEICVRDSDPAVPVPRGAQDDAEGGRGLLLVDLVSDRWGTETDPDDGKTVWFTLQV